MLNSLLALYTNNVGSKITQQCIRQLYTRPNNCIKKFITQNFFAKIGCNHGINFLKKNNRTKNSIEINILSKYIFIKINLKKN